MDKEMMKRILSYIWYGLLCFPLAAWGGEQPPSPTQATPSASNKGAESQKQTAEEKELERFREAAKVFDSTHEVKVMVDAMALLRKGFPASRPVLVECVKKASPGARCFALQVLGEQGEAAKDLEVVSKALRDSSKRVRLAAVMAIRRLGKEGFPALKEYLLWEPEPNNKKMAIKTLQTWGDRAVVPLLVHLLRKEEEKTVRNFLVTALEALSGKQLGDNADAWESYANDQSVKEQAKILLPPKKPTVEASKP
jgi:HEAT repeat protein